MNNKKIKLLALTMGLTALSVGSVYAAETTTITVIHTNDVHGVVSDNGSSTIGFGKMATYVEQKREEGHVLVLDGGDLIQGDPFANIEKGHSMVPIINQVGYDAMVVGNHEFDFGDDNLFEIEEKLDFALLSANIYQDDEHAFNPYIVREFDDTKVGIFGMSTPETLYKTHPDNVAGYEFKDIVLSSQEMVDILLDEEEVDVVIMLAHLGIEGDHTSTLVAENVEGIHLIVDGHSHTEFAQGYWVNDTMIVSAGEKLENIGEVELTLEDGKVVDINARLLGYEAFEGIEPKASIEAEINRVQEEQQQLFDIVIGSTAVDLDGERETVRAGESNLGQLATDAMLDLTNADVAFTNGGGIRASIPAGDITMGDMISVFPFGNTVVVKEVQGSDIVAALEHGLSVYPELNGAFPHTAGITFTLNAYKESGNRISDVKVAGEPIELDQMYTLATNDFLAAGGDGYTMFVDYPEAAVYNTLMDTLLDYVVATGEVQGEVETRMTVVLEGEEVTVEDEDVIVEGEVADEAVALRAYATNKGFEVEYDEVTKAISISNDAMSVVIDTVTDTYIVEGTNEQGPCEVIIIEGVAYVKTTDINSIIG